MQKRPLSATTQQRVSALAAALGDAIVAAYADAGKPGRVHPGIKSLVAAAAFDDLLRERAAAAEVAGATSDGAQRQGREGSRSESGESEGAGESDVGGHDDFHDR